MLKNMNPIGVYRWRDYHKTQSTDDVTVYGPTVLRGQVVELFHFAATDLTTANKKIAIGIVEDDGKEIYFRVNQGTTLYSVWLTGRTVLLEGDRPFAVVESPTTGDELYFIGEGIIYEAEPRGV